MKTFSRWITGGCFGLLILAAGCEEDTSCNVPCYFGSCVDNSCECQAGYEGDSCTIRVTDKYIGSWDAADSCAINHFDYIATIAASSTVVNELLITNFGGFGSTFAVTATVDGFAYTVPSQLIQGITLSGTGIIDTLTKTIAVEFTAKDQLGNNDTCRGLWTLK